MRAISADGLDRLDRSSLSLIGERKSLAALIAEEDEENDDASPDEAALLTKNPTASTSVDKERASLDLSSSRASHSRHSVNDKLLAISLDQNSHQGPISKFVYTFFGLTWHDKIFVRSQSLGPQMYYFHNIGLYTHYAGVGLSGGIQGLCSNFCYYYYNGSNNVCANASSLVFVAWGFKIFYAMFTDSYRPAGTRRKVYMIVGWVGVLFFTLLLAMIGDTCSVETWLALSVATQAFLMLADVPADGYSVELGQLESVEERGLILSTGQRIRFTFTMFAGLIQALLVNGPRTNDSGCQISVESCWSWGLTVGQYYTVITIILAVLVFPIFFLREISSAHIPLHTLKEHGKELWQTLMNPTTLFLLIFVSGNGAFSIMTPTTYSYVQYTLIGLTNFQAGIQTIVTYLAVVAGIKIFQKFFIQTNWRFTLYLSVGLSSTLGLLWILVYYNVGGLLNAWFTIFVTVNQALAQGISQVLFSMAVIELAKRGQEAITYELIISVANSASSISYIIATQLLGPMNALVCNHGDDDDSNCPSSDINVNSYSTYKATGGPWAFTKYSLLILSINICSLIFFTRFLPRQKFECAEWKQLGESGQYYLSPKNIGLFALFITVIIIGYQIASAIALLNPSTACLEAFGGSGC